MRSINKVILIGNLTRDPEMRQTPNGQSVTTFGLATNREWMTKESERKSSAEFHECVAWARLAEICDQYLKKGQLVYVEGYLKTRSWDSPEGVKKFKTEIVVKDMIRLEKRPKENDEDQDFVPSGNEEEGGSGEVQEEENATAPTASTSKTKAKEEVAEETEAKEEEAKETEDKKEAADDSDSDSSSEDPIDKDLGL